MIAMRRKGSYAGLSVDVQQAFKDLEENAVSAIRLLDDGKQDAWSVKLVGQGTFYANVGDFLICTTSTATIVLPKASAQIASKEIIVVVHATASPTIVASNCLINNVSSIAVTSNRACRLVSSDRGWFTYA